MALFPTVVPAAPMNSAFSPSNSVARSFTFFLFRISTNWLIWACTAPADFGCCVAIDTPLSLESKELDFMEAKREEQERFPGSAGMLATLWMYTLPMTKQASVIIPYLYYEDVAGALEWLARAFGFHQRERIPGSDGKIAH